MTEYGQKVLEYIRGEGWRKCQRCSVGANRIRRARKIPEPGENYISTAFQVMITDAAPYNEAGRLVEAPRTTEGQIGTSGGVEGRGGAGKLVKRRIKTWMQRIFGARRRIAIGVASR